MIRLKIINLTIHLTIHFSEKTSITLIKLASLSQQ
jgi:hypothetical protein